MRGIVLMASQTSGGPSLKALRKNRFIRAQKRAALLTALAASWFACAWGAAQSAASAVRNGTEISRPSNPTPGARPVTHSGEPVPPRVAQAERFLARRGLKPGQRFAPGLRLTPRANGRRLQIAPHPAAGPSLAAGSSTSTGATWQSLGPTAVLTANFGLVTGRVSSIALDPSDSTGNHAYIGTTGGGVWVTSNAAASNPSPISFTPLTDFVSALESADDASISIGAVAVQPGGTGVILAGTGDPNDVLDSYYGMGILRSTDGSTMPRSVAIPVSWASS